MDLLRRIASEQQAAVICVTHDETIFDRFNRIFRLRDGRLVSTASRRALTAPALALLRANRLAASRQAVRSSAHQRDCRAEWHLSILYADLGGATRWLLWGEVV
jgi:ABC-type sulfate/molybdate transport systems ATPase subunit